MTTILSPWSDSRSMWLVWVLKHTCTPRGAQDTYAVCLKLLAFAYLL